MSCESDTDYNPLEELEDGNDPINLTGHNVSKRRSQYWKYFDRTLNSNGVAHCRFCDAQISFRSSVSNLGKHLQKKHAAVLASKLLPDPLPDRKLDYTEIEREDKNNENESHVMLYFDKSDSGQEEKPRCKACDKEISPNDAIIMMKHVLSHNKHDFADKVEESILEEDFRNEADLKPRPGKVRSVAWQYFTVVDRARKRARCNLCKKVLTYSSGVSNLVKHVGRQHASAKHAADDGDGQSHTPVEALWAYFKCLDEAMRIAACLLCKKRIIYSEDSHELSRHLSKRHPNIDLDKNVTGKMFMVTDSGDLYEVETNKSELAEPLEESDLENEVYLDDETFDEPEQKVKIPIKRKSSYVALATPLKAPKKEQVTETENSIELFGKYIVSLLKKLPKKHSDRLQYEFVKQVFEVQIEKRVSEGTMTEEDNSVTSNSTRENTCYNNSENTCNNGTVIVTSNM